MDERHGGDTSRNGTMNMGNDGADGTNVTRMEPAPTSSGMPVRMRLGDDQVTESNRGHGGMEADEAEMPPDTKRSQDPLTTHGSDGTGSQDGIGTEGHGVGNAPEKRKEGDTSVSSPQSLRDRLPVILGVIAIACLIISAIAFGLQWMARHGGGTGDPVEASSDVDNTPIPIPHIKSVGMVNLSFPEGMELVVSMGEQKATWDGSSISGTMGAEVTGTATGTMIMTLPSTQDADDILVNFASPIDQPFLSFNVAMTTKDVGALTMAGTISNLPTIGTARISPSGCLVGIANADEAKDVTPIVNVTTSYTVGDGNTDYAGSYVSASASLTLGQEMREAYLTANTRDVSVSSPDAFGRGGILQTSRTTIRQNGQQSSIMGTAVLDDGDSKFEGSYEQLAENDESSKIMGRDVANVSTTEIGEEEQAVEED